VADRIPIRRAVIENAARDRPLSAGELAAELGADPRSVHQAMSRLRAAGRVRKSTRQYTRAAGSARTDVEGMSAAGVAAPLDVGALLAGLEDEAVLGDLERRQVLSRLARVGPEPVRVQAVKVLEDMDRARGRQVGPPEPVGDAELLDRIARLIYASGPTIGGKAIEAAIERWKAEAHAVRFGPRPDPAPDTSMETVQADP
jgi:hypothetical protein